MISELYPRFDSQKSFYGKAVVINEGGDLKLRSYSTIVAEIKKTENAVVYIYNGNYSRTTTRHQKEFFKQNGLSDEEIKLLFKKERLIKNKESE